MINPEPTLPPPDNRAVAARLDAMADLLEAQGEDGFRVRAYRRAAHTVARLDRPVAGLVQEGGRAALTALEGIGDGIARAIAEMLETGRWSQLDRLTGESEPEALFRTLPGIGPSLAARLHDTLHIDTLEALEAACWDGRLETVPGVGPRRIAQLRAALADRLGRRRLARRPRPEGPPVALILDVDADYRARAAEGTLRRIAPRRFNPSGEAWLPVLHARREGWDLTALFSNTRLAHDLGRTHDWVVVYAHRDDGPESQHTVVTETRGPNAGRRVVRGREDEGSAPMQPVAAQ